MESQVGLTWKAVQLDRKTSHCLMILLFVNFFGLVFPEVLMSLLKEVFLKPVQYLLYL